MHITKVELTNIKSYRHVAISLRPGTIAIRGLNGAGKSTLVEAIGFTLFDSLVYDQAQFVRESERTGTVTVGFISALDSREYEVVRRCGTGATWYVYDPELHTRVVEQKTDVTDFLRHHLRVEGEIQLKDLFNDALGVPQGTFTADFLLTPAQRKKKFDTLLQVDEYRKAAEHLNETRAYLQEQHHTQDRRIDALERDTAGLDAWRAQRAEREEEVHQLGAKLERVQTESVRVEARREQLRRTEAEVARLAGTVAVASAARDAAAVRTREAGTRHAEAAEALAICDTVRADHGAFLAAEQGLAEARRRERERNALQRQRADTLRQHEVAQHDLAHARGLYDAAVRAGRRVFELQDAVARQHELEQQRDVLERRVAERARVLQRLEALRASQEQSEQAIASTEGQLAALEAQRPEAEQRARRRSRLDQLHAAHAAHAEREKRLAAVRRELADATSQYELAAAREAKASENVRNVRARQTLADQVPELEAAHTRLERQVRQLEAGIEQHRQARQQSVQGLCPFLREPCLNIQRRGENSLAVYFDRLITRDEQALEPLRRQFGGEAEQLQRAQEARHFFERLPIYQEAQQTAAESAIAARELCARLEQEQATLRQERALAPSAEALAEAQAAFQRSDAAHTALASEQALAERLADARARGARTRQESDECLAQLASLDAAPAQLEETRAALAALGDPRAESQAQGHVAREQDAHAARVAAAERLQADLAAKLAHTEEQLLPFVALDAELQAHDAALARTRDAHTRFVQCEPLAGRAAVFAQALAAARGALAQADADHSQALAAHEAARAGFDAAELAHVTTRADALSTERGRLTEALRNTQEAAVQLAREISHAEELVDELRAAREERVALDDLEHMLQQFRDTIKEAGPNITKALLRQVSVEANRIFGEILGDRVAQLSWEADYEIMLRRDGRERTFAPLSGGEQMSAALAVRLALLRNLSRLDIAFFDEPTQNMDDERRGNLAEQIRRVRGFDQLFVISHDDTFEQGLDSVIYLEKRNGETVVVTEDARVGV